VDKFFPLGEAGLTTYRVGKRLIGVRTNDLGAGEWLRAVLRAHVVPEVDAPPNVSLFVGDADGKVRKLHRLYRGGGVVLHTRSMGRLVRAALANLDAFLAPPAGIRRIHARVLVRDGGAVLVNQRFYGQLDGIERRLERVGYQVAETHGAPVDPRTYEVVLAQPRFNVDAATVASLDREFPPEPREFHPASVRLPIAGLALPTYDDQAHEDAHREDEEDSDPSSSARSLVALANVVNVGDGVLHAEDLEFLRGLTEKGLVHRVPFSDDRDLVAGLDRIR
jgi:hypothetical protein